MPKIKTISKFVYVNVDLDKNLLLCSSNLVGLAELVEIYAPDEDTPRQACGKTLQKIQDPNVYAIHTSNEEEEMSAAQDYLVGQRCVLRVVARNRSGTIRRKFTPFEKLIVSLEKNKSFKERKVVRAKTGSVRKRNKN